VSSLGALDGMDRWVGRLVGLLAFVGAGAIIFLTLVTVVAVFWRYVLNDPIFGIEDLSAMGLSVVVAGSIAYGATRGAHISVNVLGYFAGRRLTRWTDAITRALSVAVVGLAAYALAFKGSCGIKCGAFTANLFIAHQPFYYLLAVAMGSYCLLLFLHLVRGLLSFSAPIDPNEIHD
jgi:TRAP-type C4-dicarboxylate transport system permease small subunit